MRLFPALAVMWLLAFGSAVHAQTLQDVPASADPSRAGQQFRTPVLSPREVTAGQEPAVQPVLPRALKETESFVLQSVNLQGNHTLTEETLRPLYAKLLGQRVGLEELQSIAEAITAYYRREGYILSQAMVPEQEVEQGTVTILVIEGTVDQIQIEGDTSSRQLVKQYLQNIATGQPLKAEDLERYILLADDLPGLTARAVLRPSTVTPGASDITVVVEEDKLDGLLSLDNRASRYLGPYQGGLTVGLNNLWGLNERTQLRTLVAPESNEMAFVDVTHDEYLGTEGTRLRLNASYTRAQPGSKLEAFDIEGDTNAYAMFLSHPFLRSRQSNLFGSVGFDVRDATLSILGTPIYEDKLRVASLGLSYDVADSTMAVNSINATIFSGLDVLGADDVTVGRSRANADSTYSRLAMDAARVQPIVGNWTFETAIAGQIASAPLLASEEFGVGGSGFARAFDPSEITGDHGAAGRLELQYNRVAETLDWINDYQVYGFYDLGKIWNRDVQLGSGEEKTAVIASIGTGLRFNAAQDMSGYLELAYPLLREVQANGQDGSHPRVFFALNKRF